MPKKYFQHTASDHHSALSSIPGWIEDLQPETYVALPLREIHSPLHLLEGLCALGPPPRRYILNRSGCNWRILDESRHDGVSAKSVAIDDTGEQGMYIRDRI
jgi:hypothetical protein